MDRRPFTWLCLTALVSVAAVVPLTGVGDRLLTGSLDEGGPSPRTRPENDQAAPDVAAFVGSARVTTPELDRLAAPKLVRIRSDEYAIKRRVLDERIADLLIEQEAARRSVTKDELIRREVDAKTRAVSKEEAQVVMEAAAASRGAQPSPSLNEVISGMEAQRRETRRLAFLAELRERIGVRLLFEPPRETIALRDSPSLGSKTAPVTMVVFTDFQCPYCATLADTVKKASIKYGAQLQVVVKNFPLSMHKDAQRVAEAAACAAEQGKFWPLHDWLFANQAKIPSLHLPSLDAELGVGAEALLGCIKAGRGSAAVSRDQAEGQRHGVTNTPTFFINGRYFLGAPPLDALSGLIDEELGRK